MTFKTFPSPVFIVLLAVLPGCVTHLAPSGVVPKLSIPSSWNQASSSEASALNSQWWQGFNAPELVEFIHLALEQNPDLMMATERIRQAELQVRIAKASLFPTLGFGGSTSLQRSSTSDAAVSKSSSVSLGLSYELDVWGHLSGTVDHAQALLKASQFDQDTVRLTLISGIANAYFQILVLRERIAIARENLAITEHVLKLVTSRHRNGVVSALDVSRQNTVVFSQQANLQALQLQELQTSNALAILLGRAPQGFMIVGQKIESLHLPQATPGLPAQLLTRRPDIASQEALLLAAGANVEVARAALLPGIQLTGAGGLASNALLSLTNPSNTLNVAASMAYTIFDGGQLKNQVKIAESQQREMVENYRKTVFTALKEVEDALSAVDFNARQEALQKRIHQEAQRTFFLSERRYKEGADDQLSLLDAQRTLFQTTDQLAQIRLTRITSAIDMFKALGGGWMLVHDNSWDREK